MSFSARETFLLGGTRSVGGNLAAASLSSIVQAQVGLRNREKKVMEDDWGMILLLSYFIYWIKFRPF